MKLNLALDDGLESRLEQVAKARGIDPAEFVIQMLRKELSGVSPQEPPRFCGMTDEQWRRFTTEWTEAHKTVPLLPDEALTRESIYGDHP